MVPISAYRQAYQQENDIPTCETLSPEIRKMKSYRDILKEKFFIPSDQCIKAPTQEFPRHLSLEDAKRKMQKNLLKASCEHWNKENKAIVNSLNIAIILDSTLLQKMKDEKRTLERVAQGVTRAMINQMKDSVIKETLSFRTLLTLNLDGPSLARKWHSKGTLETPYINPKTSQIAEQNKDKGITPLSFLKTEHLNIGTSRDSMEDAHFCISIEKGILLGVFDGHGGCEVANYISTAFQEHFSSFLTQANNNVHLAFEFLFDNVEKELLKREDFTYQGSTALLSFIDKKNDVFTATLGDSEANIYRKVDENLVSIPLSVLRDWSCPKEAKRAALALGRPSIEQSWPLTEEAKTLRFQGINISRTLGDLCIKTSAPNGPGIIHKPKITIFHLEHDDLLVLATDGLKSFVPEIEVLRALGTLNPSENAAERLGSLALSKMNRHVGDNIAIVALKASSPV